MTVSVPTLIAQARRFVGDYPTLDTLGASVSSTATVLSVSQNPTSDLYVKNRLIQVDSEIILVKTTATAASTMTVARAQLGSTAASHASGANVMVHPRYLDQDILDALNQALALTFPLIYKPVLDTTSWTPDSTKQQFQIPSTCRYIAGIDFLDPGDPGNAFYPVRGWRIRRGATSYVEFRTAPVEGTTIRVRGYGPFSDLTLSGSTDAQFPDEAAKVLVLGAYEYLLASGEATRVRVDTGVIDNREQANRTGSSMLAANAMLSRFERALQRHAMPPMPRHVVSVF